MEEKEQLEDHEIKRSKENTEYLENMFSLLALGAVYLGIALLSTSEKTNESDL